MSNSFYKILIITIFPTFCVTILWMIHWEKKSQFILNQINRFWFFSFFGWGSSKIRYNWKIAWIELFYISDDFTCITSVFSQPCQIGLHISIILLGNLTLPILILSYTTVIIFLRLYLSCWIKYIMRGRNLLFLVHVVSQ